jgi:hypothetical protein
LNSLPQLLARERRGVAQGAQLGPGDLRMDAAAQAAVDGGYDVFSAHDVGERDEAIGYQFRMFDEAGGVHKLRPGLAMQQIRSESQGG